VEQDSIVQCLKPVGLREVGVRKHSLGFVKEHAVEPFGDAIVLWCIGRHHFVCDTVVLEILLDMFCHVLPPSIRAKGFDFESCLQLSFCDECLEMVSDLRLSLEWCNANPAGLVISEGYKVFVPSMGLCGQRTTHIAKDMPKNMLRTC